VRVFLDTNVLVAAFATRGLCADLLRSVLADHELALSGTVLEALTRALDERIRVPEPAVREITQFLRASASLVEVPVHRPPVTARDSVAAAVLNVALAVGADALVTGDKDLLEAREVPGIRILDPRGFWQLVRELTESLSVLLQDRASR
jgi:putative PIN family toxin of toxin-antitoxin system